MDVPEISVVIVNYRGWEVLGSCLDALRSCAERFPVEVVVVDNHSDDGMAEVFVRRYPEAKFILQGRNEGFARANNVGVRHSRGRYLLFLNPDTELSCRALERLYEASQRLGDEVLLSLRQRNRRGRDEGVMRSFPSAWTVSFLTRPFYQVLWRMRHRSRCREGGELHPDWVSGSLVWMSRRLFDRTGGWDEHYWLYYEDVDLCRRVWRHGGRVILFCDPPVLHHHGGTTRRDKKMVAFFKSYVLISRHIYYRRHYPGAGGSLLLLLMVLNNLLAEQLLPALAGALLYPFGVARRYLFIYFYLVRYYLRVLSLRRWSVDPDELTSRKKKER